MKNSSFQVTRESFRHLTVTDMSPRYEWYTPWMLATGVDTVRCVWKAFNVANLATAPAIQTAATRPDNPDAPTALATVQTGAGEFNTGDVSVTTSTANALWFRLGIVYEGATVNFGQGDIGLVASWKQVADLVDTTTVQLSANDSTPAAPRVAVLSRWIPTTWVNKFKAGLLVTGVTGAGSLEFALAIQVANTSVQVPSAWTVPSIFDSWRVLSGNYEYNSDELVVPTTTTAMWVRLGAVYTLVSGTTQTSATLTARISIRGS